MSERANPTALVPGAAVMGSLAQMADAIERRDDDTARRVLTEAPLQKWLKSMRSLGMVPRSRDT